MKVVHICTTLEGGAGLCAARIIKATRNLNVEAKVLVARGNKSKDEDVVSLMSWPARTFNRRTLSFTFLVK